MIKKLSIVGIAAVALCTSALAQQFFRIGTGGTAGTYFPVGGMIANVISRDGKVVATAQSSGGSLANVNGIVGGSIEAGFSQADVATWAYSGTGQFEGKPKIESLRLIATMYPEQIHIVARKDANINSVADLKDKRVAVDEPGSGTLVNARSILAAYGLSEKDIKAQYIKPDQASNKIKDGSLDAYFFTGGAPAGAISELAASGTGITIVPIDGAQADKIIASSPFFSKDTISANTYKDVGKTSTLAVNAQLITSSKMPDALIYEVTKSIYSDYGQAKLKAGHAKGVFINAKNGVSGAGIPFHPGAQKYFREIGLLK